MASRLLYRHVEPSAEPILALICPASTRQSNQKDVPGAQDTGGARVGRGCPRWRCHLGSEVGQQRLDDRGGQAADDRIHHRVSGLIRVWALSRRAPGPPTLSWPRSDQARRIEVDDRRPGIGPVGARPKGRSHPRRSRSGSGELSGGWSAMRSCHLGPCPSSQLGDCQQPAPEVLEGFEGCACGAGGHVAGAVWRRKVESAALAGFARDRAEPPGPGALGPVDPVQASPGNRLLTAVEKAGSVTLGERWTHLGPPCPVVTNVSLRHGGGEGHGRSRCVPGQRIEAHGHRSTISIAQRQHALSTLS